MNSYNDPSNYKQYNFGAVPSWTNAVWPGGYRAFQNTDQIQSAVHEWAWSSPEYPGYWDFYAKGSQFRKCRIGYCFGAAGALGATPISGGWHA